VSVTITAVIFAFPPPPVLSLGEGRTAGGKAKILLEKQEQSVAKECHFLV